MSNRLAHETSPYLLQHAHNPVDWYPWGPEALARAAAEDKPILLSIGYAACHWCHVMERESFENDEIARVMNEHFVCIKVDREERPDLDDIYMAATVAMSGSGGWPMTVFLTPDQRPFFAGTYFPPTDKYGRPGFRTLLDKISELWQRDRPALLDQASELTEHVRTQSEAIRPGGIDADTIAGAAEQLALAFDPRFGGFGSAPKFPPSPALALLLRHHHRSGDSRALEMVQKTLDGMKNGGIYDQLGAGFARYSTDERWLVPHFEKMLYDNAQLARIYLEAWQVTGDPEYRRVASETLDYIVREMQAPDGGYFSATDADSEGEEGKFFVWQFDEIQELLGEPDADRFSLYYDVSPNGNWEGKSVLQTPRPLDQVAKQLGISAVELERSLASAKQTLYEARQRRVPPLTDDKVLTAWNGLMIGAMAEGYRVLREPRYLASAERAAAYVLERLVRPDGGLYRTARADKAHLDGYLEDYAFFADALLDLYEAGGSARFFDKAIELAERMLRDFADPEDGAFFQTAHGHETLIVRTRDGHDGAIPNANAVAARLLARLAAHLGSDTYREHAEGALRAYGKLIERSPRAFATSLGVVDFLLSGPIELVIAGSPEAAEPFWRDVGRRYLPNRIIAHAAGTAEQPLLEGKAPIDGKPALYVCKGFVCQAPITDPAQIDAALGTSAPEARTTLSERKTPGRATPEATRAYAARHANRGFIELGKTELFVSRLGFGGYRVHADVPTHCAALAKALTEGINLIDTSTNYTDGGSERLVGEVIADLMRAKRLSREEVVVVSKIGYVQGQNLELAERRRAEGRPFAEMVEYGPGIWHCIHPEWLEDQLTRSLERLRLETLDVCLLHNPEYFLSDAIKRGRGPLSELRDEFYARLSRAFAQLEQEVKRGRIGSYGVSSNTSVAGADARETTELTRMLAAAREAGGDAHHFRVLQLPLNLIESQAAFEPNNDGKTVLEYARKQRIAVLVNRPLNAIREDGLVRLADPPKFDGAPPFETQLARVQGLEQEFRRTFAPMLKTSAGTPPAESLLAWGEQLARIPAGVRTLAQWGDIEAQVVAPRTAQVLRALDQALRGPLAERWQEFRERYVDALEALLSSIRERASEGSRVQAGALHRAIDDALPDARRDEPLSRKALWVAMSTRGVTSVLVGMREPAYVDDALAILDWELLTDAPVALRAALEARL
jgi:uncharacterized protein YyaL (SSP411 family)/aryl-alcohol dehydrogenase-like predicted oxidoreductase